MNIANYTFIVITLMLFMQFAGVPTGLNSIFNYFGIGFSPSDNSLTSFNGTAYISSGDTSQSNSFWDYIFNNGTGLIAGLVAAGIAAGLFISGRADIAINASIASGVLVLFLPTLVFFTGYAIANNFSSWATGIIAMIFIPLTVGYVIALFKYITGAQ